MKKLFKIAAAALAAASIAATVGCGGKGNDPFTDSTKADGKYNITVACQDENGEKAYMEEVKKQYELLHSDVNVNIVTFTQTLPAYMANYATNQDKLPDVLWLPDDYFASFAQGGYFLDLRSFYEQDAATDYSLYYESMLHAASYTGEFKPTTSYSGTFVSEKSDDGKYGLYFAPRDYNKIAIVYNKRVLKKLGLSNEIPDTSNGWTMDEFIAFCKKISGVIEENPAYGNYKALFANFGWEVVYTTIMNTLGSDGMTKADGSLNYDSDTNKAIFDKLYDELFSDPNILASEENNFLQGTVAMRVIPRPAIVGLNTMVDEDGNPYYDFLPFPSKKSDGTMATGAGCSGYGIVKRHAEEEQTVNGVTKKVKNIAWDLIKYMISEEGQQATGKMGTIQPVLKSLEANGTWKTAISADLNHSAFSMGGELRLDSFNKYDPKTRTTLRSYVTGFWANLSKKEEGKPGDTRTKLIDDAIKNFDSAKKSI